MHIEISLLIIINNMEHIFQNIQGWFSFPEFYKSVVKEAKDNSTFVEVGTWKGRSASFMAVEIANSNKKIDFYCVDTWNGSAEHKGEEHVVKGTLYEHFLSNIEPVKSFIKPIRSTSLEAAKQFSFNSLDFVFIDASHDYENVKKDIEAWYPRVKPGGIFSGHDYASDWPGVMRAANEFAQNNNLFLKSQERCWIVTKR